MRRVPFGEGLGGSAVTLAAGVVAGAAHAPPALTDVEVVAAVRVTLRAVRHLRQPVPFAVRVPTLGDHVRLIVRIGADEDVVRSHALAVVAVVAEVHAFGDRPDHAFVDDAMRECCGALLRPIVDVDRAVAVRANLAAVLPTALTDGRLVQGADVRRGARALRTHAALPGKLAGHASTVSHEVSVLHAPPMAAAVWYTLIPVVETSNTPSTPATLE